jgi:hypothetical protein
MNTVRLAAEEGGFDYISDSYADDLPYWIRRADRDQLIIPYTLDANDMRFATPQGFNAGDQFEAYLKDSFDALYAEGGRMMSVGLHCRLVGPPGPDHGAEALPRLRGGPRRRLVPAPDRHRPTTGPRTTRRSGVPRPSEMGKAAFVRGLRRDLRAFAVDRRRGLVAGTRPRARHRHRPAQRARPRLPCSVEDKRLGVLAGPPRSRGQTRQARNG